MSTTDRKDKWAPSEVKLRRDEKQLETAAGIMGAGTAASLAGAAHQGHHGLKDEKKKLHLQDTMRDPMARVTPEHMERETKLASRSKKRLNRATALGLTAGVLGTGALAAWGTSGETKERRREIRRQREGLEQALSNRGIELRVDGSRAEQRRAAAEKSGDADRVVTKSYEIVSKGKKDLLPKGKRVEPKKVEPEWVEPEWVEPKYIKMKKAFNPVPRGKKHAAARTKEEKRFEAYHKGSRQQNKEGRIRGYYPSPQARERLEDLEAHRNRVNRSVKKSDAGWKWEGPGGDDAGERRWSRKETWPTRGKQPKRKVKVLRSGDAVQKALWKFGAKKAKKAVPYKQPGPGEPGFGPGPTGPKPPPPLKGGPLGRPVNEYSTPQTSSYPPYSGPTGPNVPRGKTTPAPKPPMTAEQKRAAEMRDPNSERRKILDAEEAARKKRESWGAYERANYAYKDSMQRPA